MGGKHAHRRQVRDLIDLLDRGLGQRETLPHFLAGLRELTEADHSFAISYRLGAAHLITETVEGDRIDPAHFRATLDRYLADSPVVGWSKYNPIRPEPEQRNAMIGWDDLVRLYGTDWSPGREQLYPKLGIHKDDQLRVLVCDGPSLLAFVGITRDRPFSRTERQRFEALIEPLQRHLKRDRELSLGSFGLTALDAALAAIGAPALVVRESQVVLANEAGRAWLERDSRDVAQAIGSGQSAHGRLERTALQARGLGTHELLVLRPSAPSHSARLERYAKKIGLTPRQRDVLGLLVEGRSNRTIAAVLGISERTLEVHVSAVLARADCDSRSELIARALSDSG